ncbi:hypothetical protein GQ53DRAFT_870729 [Thozetella sp. PMI_491]|nr:hypothetical protein GQ53DRAFT_870729 [Thozetella sp. PMI_491]
METPVRKVRLACRRCRARRIKCDGGVPACSNCTKAGETCVDVDSQNRDASIPRNFIHAARSRIQWLEDIIQSRLPDVDLHGGPQVPVLPGVAAASPTAAHSSTRTLADPQSALAIGLERQGGSSLSATQLSQSHKRPAEASVSDDNDAVSIAEGAHSVAHDLGMLSLNSDSSQKHYMGSSSGLLFTNLIGAYPPSDRSRLSTEDSIEDASAQLLGMVASQGTPLRETYRDLNSLLRQELPPREDAFALASAYIRSMHPEHPVLDAPSIFSALEALYDSSSHSLDDDILVNGWPRATRAFRWNGQLVEPTRTKDPAVSMPVVAFILFMTFNIAAIIKVRSRIYEFAPEKYYKSALHFASHTFSHISLSTIQAVVLLAVRSLLTPAEAHLWTLIHIAMAHCVEIGVHRDNARVAPQHRCHQEIRRSVFFSVYHLDRTISSVQGRPLGFRDETFDVKLPEPYTEGQLGREGPVPSGFLIAAADYSRLNFQLDRIVSDTKLLFYHLPVQSTIFTWPADPRVQQRKTQAALDQWWAQTSEISSLHKVDNHQRKVWQLKLKIRYHTTKLLLFQPSQVIKTPSEASLAICFDSACSIIESYQKLYEAHALHHSWRTVQNVFAAGASIIYTFWTSKSVQRSSSAPALSKTLRTCSSLLTIGGEWWPSAKRASVRFGSVADLTIRKLYTDAAVSKQPRLLYRPDIEAPAPTMTTDAELTQTSALDQMGGSRDGSSMNQFGWAGDIVDPALQHGGQATAGWTALTGTTLDAEGGLPQDLSLGTGMTQEYTPEIENFFAQFGRAEFSWTFRLDDEPEQDLSPDFFDAVF